MGVEYPLCRGRRAPPRGQRIASAICGLGCLLCLEVFGCRASPAAVTPTPTPSKATELRIERLLEWGCAALEGGRIICPDPDRGTPTFGCEMRVASGPVASEAPAASGTSFDCARDAAGSVSCWGENEEGGL